MHRYIWLIPLLPLAGAAINGLLGRKFRFSEKLVSAIAVGSVALAFLIGVAAVASYASSVWPKAYVTSEDGAFRYTWIPGGAVALTQGEKGQEGAGVHVTPGEALDAHGQPVGHEVQGTGINPVQHSEFAAHEGEAETGPNQPPIVGAEHAGATPGTPSLGELEKARAPVL